MTGVMQHVDLQWNLLFIFVVEYKIPISKESWVKAQIELRYWAQSMVMMASSKAVHKKEHTTF